MNKQDLQFEIDQLRKDKIIYAVESVACTLAAFIFVFSIGSFFPDIAGREILIGPFVIAFGYWIFTVYGNTKRFMKIRELEKKLK